MMPSPNLQVPDTRTADRPRSSLSGLVFVLLLLLLVVQVLSLFVSKKPGGLSFHPRSPLASEQQKSLAAKLENANLPQEAADAWEQYLAMVDLEPVENGTIHYRIGKLRQEAGEHTKAIAQYYLAEELIGDSSPDLKRQIDLRVVECLRGLGRYQELAREIARRSTDQAGDTELKGQQVVAQIGDEKITVTDFERMLSSEIEMAIKSRMGLSAEEEDALRQRSYEMYADPKVRAEQLSRFVATKVLADVAREEKLDESKDFRDRLTALADNILASTLMYREVQKRGTVTDEDVKRFYAANKERYDKPPATFIAHILCRDEDQARKIIDRIKGGESFDKIARAESLDTSTRDKMGIIATPVLADGEQVPLFGANAELHDTIRDTGAGDILDQPYKNDRGWHVIKVVSHREKVEQPFDDIKDEVRRDTVAARQREVSEQFIKELFEKKHVKLYPEVFTKAGASKEDDQGKETANAPETGS
jgi:peptidyl-prolyl cis-trans isomerase C